MVIERKGKPSKETAHGPGVGSPLGDCMVLIWVGPLRETAHSPDVCSPLKDCMALMWAV